MGSYAVGAEDGWEEVLGAEVIVGGLVTVEGNDEEEGLADGTWVVTELLGAEVMVGAEEGLADGNWVVGELLGGEVVVGAPVTVVGTDVKVGVVDGFCVEELLGAEVMTGTVGVVGGMDVLAGLIAGA